MSQNRSLDKNPRSKDTHLRQVYINIKFFHPYEKDQAIGWLLPRYLLSSYAKAVRKLSDRKKPSLWIVQQCSSHVSEVNDGRAKCCGIRALSPFGVKVENESSCCIEYHG